MKNLILIFALVFGFAPHADEIFDGPPPANRSEAKQYVIMVAGLWHKDGAGSSVGVSAARGPDFKAAKNAALQECQKIVWQDPSQCKVIDKFTNGCEYLAWGNNLFGQSGYGVGTTPQEAYDKCHKQGLNCYIPVTGKCDNPANEMRLDDVVVARRLRPWMSLVVGRGTMGTITHVGIASRMRVDQTTAENTALAACSNASPDLSCHVLTSFNKGCGYLTKGHSESTGAVDYGFGVTKDAAYEDCIGKGSGMACDGSTIGGCVEP